MKVATRTCVACRERTEKSGLLRFVAAGSAVLWDEFQAMPGRGAYLHEREACIRRVVERGMWERAFRLSGGAVEIMELRRLAGELWVRRHKEIRDGVDAVHGAPPLGRGGKLRL